MKTNIEKNNLSDEELKNVSGGTSSSSNGTFCPNLKKAECNNTPGCYWVAKKRACSITPNPIICVEPDTVKL